MKSEGSKLRFSKAEVNMGDDTFSTDSGTKNLHPTNGTPDLSLFTSFILIHIVVHY